MLTPSAQLGFPRRVVSLYLLFCLGAVLLLTGGAVFAVKSLLKSQATGDALTQVGRLTASVEMDRLTTGGSQAQALIDQAKLKGGLSYCAVIGVDGRFLAHTDRTVVGSQAMEPIGSQLRWGDIDGVRYLDDKQCLVSEYRSPLSINNKPAGELVLALAAPNEGAVIKEIAQHAPLAILGPFVLIGLGCWWLRRATAHLSGIEERLSVIARQTHHEPLRFKSVSPHGVAAVGWNRVVEYFEELAQPSPSETAEEKLHQLAASANGGGAAALQSLTDGIAVTGPEGRIDFANHAIAALLGSDESLDGADFDELLRSLSPEKGAEITSGNPHAETVAELPLTTAAGDRVLRLARAPLLGDAGAGHVWCVRDVTQQKLAEASRDQFIDTATHELRTPLANIKAYAETLAMGDQLDIEEQKEFCNTINTEATRLARFVDDLLSISSIEVGSLGVQRQKVEVRRLLEESAEKVRPLMKQRDLTFEVKLAEKLGEAKLDKDKVSGLVVNLLGNAAKYTPEGGQVTFTASRQEDEIKIEVTDTGVGISEDEQAKVFDKFFRSANPDVLDQVGTGLGLSLAREIARLHRGDLTLTSKLGEGSTFTANLPVQ